jgi:hypothetical protein
MHCLGDWKKVVHQGPWTFRGWAVLIEDYDGKEDPEKISFGSLFVWEQIHGILELYRKPDVVDDLARRIGKTREVQMSPKLFYEGNYVRIHVMIDVYNSLKHVVSLNVEGEGKKWLFVRYERFLSFANIAVVLATIMKNAEMVSGRCSRRTTSPLLSEPFDGERSSSAAGGSSGQQHSGKGWRGSCSRRGTAGGGARLLLRSWRARLLSWRARLLSWRQRLLCYWSGRGWPAGARDQLRRACLAPARRAQVRSSVYFQIRTTIGQENIQ